METKATQVLVVGGGLVGLSSAVFLAARGVKTLVIDKHAASSLHPRAIGFTQRTMELLRSVGMGDTIPQVPPGTRLRRVRVESLAGKWFEEAPWTPEPVSAAKLEYSPHTGAAIAQDRLEPMLRDRAVALSAEIQMSTELVRFTQDATGVTALVRQRDGKEYEVRADYLIGADGHRSPVRQALGIKTRGRGLLQVLRSVLFRAPLEEYLAKGVAQFSIDQPDFPAFLTTYADGRWVLMFSDDVERDEATLHTLIHRAIGRTDLPIEIITTGRWELSATVCETFQSGRVFLAGDAAHTLPPSRGGYGANTGIDDAANLAWKLSAVLSGASTPRLLETYSAEREAIAWLRHQQIFAREDYKARGGGIADGVKVLDDVAMEFGQLYRSTAVLGAGPELAAAARPEEWKGQPGTRAPFARVPGGDERASTIDAVIGGWTLLTDDERWRAAADAVSRKLGIEVQCVCLGVDLKPSDPVAFRAMLGLEHGGGTLVRPDGYIAWRSVHAPADLTQTLTTALASVSSAARAS